MLPFSAFGNDVLCWTSEASSHGVEDIRTSLHLWSCCLLRHNRCLWAIIPFCYSSELWPSAMAQVSGRQLTQAWLSLTLWSFQFLWAVYYIFVIEVHVLQSYYQPHCGFQRMSLLKCSFIWFVSCYWLIPVVFFVLYFVFFSSDSFFKGEKFGVN